MGILLLVALFRLLASSTGRMTDLIVRNVRRQLDPALSARFRQALEQAGIPYGFGVGWGLVEASGSMATVDLSIAKWAAAGGERGWFQISPDESHDRGYTHTRIATDDSYTITTGIDLVLGYYHAAVAGGAAAGSQVAWGLAKLMHGLGSSATKKLLASATPDSLTTWEAWKAFASPYGAAVRHWLANVDRVFVAGATHGPLENAPAANA